MNNLCFSRYAKTDNRRKSQNHYLKFKESGMMPGAFSTMKGINVREKGYSISSPGKFNPLGKESPLMKIEKSLPSANNTMSRFYSARREHGNTEIKIPNIKTLSSVESAGFNTDTTVNVKGKLMSLEHEILEVYQVLNLHKKEVELLRMKKETLQQVLNK